MNSSKSSTLNSSLLKNILLLTGGGISLVFLIILVSIWQTGNKFFDTVSSIFNPIITSPQIDTSNLIVKQIRGVSELATTVFVMDTIVPTSSQRKVGNWVVGETNLLYIARGEVKAGIDLSAIEPENVSMVDQKVQIQLPSPSILDYKIDVNNSQVYDYNRGFLNLGPDVALKLQTEAQRQTLTKVVETACSQGILTQANQRAEIVITQLLQTSGYEEVEVKTTSPKNCHHINQNPKLKNKISMVKEF